MKVSKVEMAIYIIAVVVAIGIIAFASLSKNNATQGEEFDAEAYMKEIVETSRIRVNDDIYHGVYESTEVTELPAGYELLGEIVESSGDELTGHLQSNSITAGVQVFGNASDNSKIYIKIPQTDIESYVEYVLEVQE